MRILTFSSRLIAISALMVLSALCARAADEPALFPLADVHPGLKGYIDTIFSGDTVERVDLEVIGVLHNAIGPKQDVILVRLLGDKVAQTGVVAGMSGSPVYFDGKLAGALSLKLGTFTREAIGGVTPISEMIDVEKSSDAAAIQGKSLMAASDPAAAVIPANLAHEAGVGGGQTLVPIETPLIFTGLFPRTLAQFANVFSSWGMSMSAGGSAAPATTDGDLKPGDMVGIDLIRGDFSVSSGCTVTMIDAGHVLACGHPVFGFGATTMGLSRAHVVMTLASAQESTKIIDTGGEIGTLTQDRQTAVMGLLGKGPAMIPVHLAVDSPGGEKQFSFEVAPIAQLTPQLVAISAYNGITETPEYAGGKTLELDGTISIKGHSSVHLKDTFSATDATTQTGLAAALSVQQAFSDIYSNPYEVPQIEGIDLHVKELTDRRWATIDSAWSEETEVHPGDKVHIKVLLRPYRGASFVQDIPISIPLQTAAGNVAVAVSDASYLNRNVQLATFTSEGKLPGLEQLISLVNQEHRNDRLYATLLQPTPTLLFDDKQMPNVPASAINVLDERPNPARARLQLQSAAGEWSVDMNQVISGQQFVTITIK
jgi:SpoIVB peptidase S55